MRCFSEELTTVEACLSDRRLSVSLIIWNDVQKLLKQVMRNCRVYSSLFNMGSLSEKCKQKVSNC